MQKTILCFVAHADDLEIGMGGTVAKYAKEGKQVINVIFSLGEKSNPLLQESHVIKTRVNEAYEIDKLIGIKKTILLGLSDLKLDKQIKEKYVKSKIRQIIKKYDPEKIFTHSLDTHKDHRVVHDTVISVVKKLKKKYQLYTFDIWKMLDIKESKPKLYIDITNTFKKKIQAIKKFKSQLFYTYLLLPSVYYKAIINGRQLKVKYAEMFYKER